VFNVKNTIIIEKHCRLNIVRKILLVRNIIASSNVMKINSEINIDIQHVAEIYRLINSPLLLFQTVILFIQRDSRSCAIGRYRTGEIQKASLRNHTILLTQSSCSPGNIPSDIMTVVINYRLCTHLTNTQSIQCHILSPNERVFLYGSVSISFIIIVDIRWIEI